MSPTADSAPPMLFDRTLRVRRRDRAAAGLHKVDYLHRAAADSLVYRLEAVTRKFPHVAILAAADGIYARALSGRFGIERLRQIEASPILTARAQAAAPDGDVTVGDIDSGVALTPQSYDLIVFGLDLHAVNDPVGALIQARHALRPDGLCLAALFGGDSLHELRTALSEAEIEIEGGLSPRVAPMADVRALGGLLQRAGYAMPVADADRLEVWHPTPLHLMRELRAMGESNCLTDRRKTPLRRATLARALEIYRQRFSRPDSKTRATFEIVTLTGWAPAPSQPQPLRPGAASTRLATALGVEERPAGETAPPPHEKS
ncbi:MAG: class I SAM-dependent methyltransferase [Rhodobacteraceae bacterium]|nr:class I SAM-dependent methyltransferase [Paracoccaceae bacterium]